MSDALIQMETAHQVQLKDAGNDFQRRARLLQAMWREERGYPIGRYTPGGHEERTMGSLLEMPWAQETLANYLTETIREVFRSEVLDPVKSRGKKYTPPRIYDNLLSSQPMCFNLAAELQRDLELATAVFQDLIGGEVGRVTGIEFEHSPGRWSPRYTNDGSAFDVFVEFLTPRGRSGFTGIEVKYHEPLEEGVGKHRREYDDVARLMGCFSPDPEHDLHKNPLQQIWHGHLLAGSMLHADDYEHGHFVVLRPGGNAVCADGVRRYRTFLTCEDTFAEWTLEDVVDSLRRHTDAAWVELFHDRYLAFEKVEAAARST